MALLPLLVVLPLLIGALVVWGNSAYDRLLITKVRSDLSVARGYFDQVLGNVGSGALAVASSHSLHLALDKHDASALQDLLAQARANMGFDFVNLYNPQGFLLSSDWGTHQPGPSGLLKIDLEGAG